MFCKARLFRRTPFLIFALCLSVVFPAVAQQPAPPSWERLTSVAKGLAPRTKVHVSGDKGSKKCSLESVSDEALVCSKGHTQFTFPRAEVKSVKLTRPLRSTLVGIGLGLGVGLGVGAIAGHVEAPAQPGAFLDFSDLTRDAFILAGGVAGAIGGGVAGGTTDFLRGPGLYQRTASAPPAPAASRP